MAGNSSADDEEMEYALRLSMMVNDNTTNGTEPQSNYATEVGGTQSRSTASPEEFAQMFALCLATANRKYTDFLKILNNKNFYKFLDFYRRFRVLLHY